MADKIIRYTKQDMLFLHDSPLVEKPDSMPSLASWFGEDANSPTPKSILNGTVITRAADKSIVLGPTKTNFASSLHSGLKNDTTLRKPQTRYGNRQLEETRNYIKDFKQPRSPSNLNERGFSMRSFDNNNSRGDTKKYLPASPHSTRRNDRHNNDKSRRDHTNNHYKHHTNGYEQENTEKVPEWMDYSPEVEKESKKESQFPNDLEAWKADMKKKDDTVDHPPLAKQEHTQGKQGKQQQQQQQQASPTVSIQQQQQQQQQLLSSMGQKEKGIDDLLNSMTMDSQDPTGFFDDSDLVIHRENSKGGSRFAKFFAKRDEPAPKEQTRSITVNELFQGQPSSSPPLSERPPIMPLNQPRVLSEEDVLKSLGAQKASPELANNTSNNEDAMGFNRILQILSQPKPGTDHLPSSSSATTELSTPPLNDEKPKANAAIASAMMVNGGPSSSSSSSSSSNINTNTTTSASTTTNTTATTKSASHNRFGSNLPTSVLRQMSARSSEGRSPSLSSSTKPTTPSMHYSPIQQHHQQHHPHHLQQQQQQTNVKSMPPPYPVNNNNNNNYSPHLPMMDLHHYEQQLHPYANNELLGSPVLPPHLTFRQQQQQQQRNEPYMPQPTALPPGAAPPRPPMMPPHLPPPPHLQYQQRFPLQDMMPPIPPHMMTNGMPPMFTKNQGWERH